MRPALGTSYAFFKQSISNLLDCYCYSYSLHTITITVSILLLNFLLPLRLLYYYEEMKKMKTVTGSRL